MVIQDNGSGACHIVTMNMLTAQESAKALASVMIRFPTRKSLRTGNATHFVNARVRDLLEQGGIRHIQSVHYVIIEQREQSEKFKRE